MSRLFSIRAGRGNEVREWAGTAEARIFLKELAVGAPYARATEEARLALERMGIGNQR